MFQSQRFALVAQQARQSCSLPPSLCRKDWTHCIYWHAGTAIEHRERYISWCIHCVLHCLKEIRLVFERPLLPQLPNGSSPRRRMCPTIQRHNVNIFVKSRALFKIFGLAEQLSAFISTKAIVPADIRFNLIQNRVGNSHADHLATWPHPTIETFLCSGFPGGPLTSRIANKAIQILIDDFLLTSFEIQTPT